MGIKKTLVVLVLGLLLVGAAGPMIINPVGAQSQNKNGGGLTERLVTNLVEIVMKLLPPELTGKLVNSLISNPQLAEILPKVVSMLDVESLAGTVNTLLEDNPNFLSDLVGELDTEPLGMAVNTLLEDNPAFLSDLVGKLDTEPLGMAVNRLFDDNPAFVGNLLAYLDPEACGTMASVLMEENPTFISDCEKYVDTDALNTLLNNVFEETFMRDYAEATVILPKGHITELTVILPPPLDELLGQKEITLKVKADAVIDSSEAYITDIRLKKGPVPWGGKK
jgi:hypothetical protein